MAPGPTAPPRQKAPVIHPYTRALIRWRGQHLALACRLLRHGEEDWTWTAIDRYPVYDGRTNEDPKPSASPRRVLVPSHYRVEIPGLVSETVTFAPDHVDLTPRMLDRARRIMRHAGLLPAWEAYLTTPHPPTIFQKHPRDGVTPSQQTRGNPELRDAAAVMGILGSEQLIEGPVPLGAMPFT